MDTSAVDLPALAVGFLVAGLITVALQWADRAGQRRVWMAAVAVCLTMLGVGFADLLRETPRETHVATILIGVPLPILGALGMQRAARRVRPWARWSLVFVTALVLLFSGLLFGAAIMPRFLP